MRIPGAAWLVGTAWLACSCAIGGHGAAVPSPGADPWGRLPGAAALLAQAEGAPAATREGWRLRGAARRARGSLFAGAPLEAQVPATAAGTIWLKIPGGSAEVGVRRAGATASPGRAVGPSVTYENAAAGLDARVFAAGGGLEDLVLVRAPDARLTYEFQLPEGWSLAPGERADEVEIRNARGLAALRLSAPICWTDAAESRALSLRIEGPRVEVKASDGVEDAPLGSCRVVDPGFSSAIALPSALSGHVAVLLPSGEVLIAGGQDSAQQVLSSLFLYDPFTGLLGPACNDGTSAMSSPRADLTGTLLRGGRVLLMGGSAKNGGSPLASAEIYDPLTRTVEDSPTHPLAGRSQHTSTLLPDGRVLLAGGEHGTTVSPEIFDPANSSFSAQGPSIVSRYSHAAALLPSGRVLLVGGRQFATNNMDLPSDSAEVFDPTTGQSSAIGSLGVARAQPSATLLESGDVLVAGGLEAPQKPVASMEILPAGGTEFLPVSGMMVARAGHTASLLPSGGVALVGGTSTAPIKQQLAAELRESGDGTVSSLGDALFLHYAGATSTVLPTGEVVIAGGNTPASELLAEAPVPGTLGGNDGPWPPQTQAMPLTSGAILLLSTPTFGDSTASYPVKRLDPITGDLASGPLFPASLGASSGVVLRDGRVLVAGGQSYTETAPGSGSFDLHLTDEAWIYDPAGDALTPTGALGQKRGPTTKTLLHDGRVLVVGGLVENHEVINGHDYATDDPSGLAEIYDPVAGTFTPTGSLDHPRNFPTSTRLASGDVLVAGGSPLIVSGDASAEIFHVDAASKVGAFSLVAGTMAQARLAHGAVLLADGRVALIGGRSGDQFLASIEIFDPADGSFSAGGTLQRVRAHHTATLLPSGQVLVAGGETKLGSPVAEIEIFDPRSKTSSIVGEMLHSRVDHAATLLPTGEVLLIGGGPAESERFAPRPLRDSLRPQLTGLPSSVAGGAVADLTGAHLDGFSEAGTGTSAGGTSRVPVAVWMPFGGGMIPGGVTSWTATTASYRAPVTTMNGPGWLFLVTTGVPSIARGLTVGPGVTGAPCQLGAECGSGFCVEGVCCTAACDGGCEACTAARKNQGQDGVCEPVADMTNPKGACFDSKDCKSAAYCDGKGQCAFAPQGKVCGASATCEGGIFAADATCDGQGQCLTTTMTKHCDPYVCAGPGAAVGCTTSCQTSADCAPDAFCQGGACHAAGEVGASCTDLSQCQKLGLGSDGKPAAYCVDGFCCNAPCDGSCEACAKELTGSDSGVCSPIPKDTDPQQECPATDTSTCGTSGACGGQRQCQFWGSEAVCQPPSCTQGTGVNESVQISHTCDGLGGCLASNSSCGLYRCDPSLITCLTSCTKDADCRDNAFCEAGTCQPRSQRGEACSPPGHCPLGDPCVDGVCCNAACDGQCEACDVTGSVGLCVPIPAGQSPHGGRAACVAEDASCGGVCNGKDNLCDYPPTDTPCGTPRCDNSQPKPLFVRACTGDGRCGGEKSVSCLAFACDDAAGACWSRCERDEQCATGNACHDGSCQPRHQRDHRRRPPGLPPLPLHRHRGLPQCLHHQRGLRRRKPLQRRRQVRPARQPRGRH
jgi:hypothetical protein